MGTSPVMKSHLLLIDSLADDFVQERANYGPRAICGPLSFFI